MPRWKVRQGDCLEVLKGCPSDFFDAMVTDPPAGIGFMGSRNEWDSDKGGRDEWISWLEGVMREAMRTLKPGAHCLVWALPRTSHWTATALENAGFEVRDCVTHHFGSGFPKSCDISKHIDRMAGAEREVVGKHPQPARQKRVATMGRPEHSGSGWQNEPVITTPTTDAAKQWDGWGTALKPAAEFWWLARKPLAEKSIARQVLANGCGGLNIDGCRVERVEGDVPGWHKTGANGSGGFNGTDTFSIRPMSPEEVQERCSGGRWPANLLLSHCPDCGIECVEACPVAELDRQGGKQKGAGPRPLKRRESLHDTEAGWGMRHSEDAGSSYGDSGGASRFFPTFRYQAKPSRGEKEAGLQDLPTVTHHRMRPDADPEKLTGLNKEGRWAPVQVRNNHPTVKSIALCRWLCRLITPPGGAVLDPFAGSGSIGCAALLEGFDFCGIEQDPHYVEIATARLKHWENQS